MKERAKPIPYISVSRQTDGAGAAYIMVGERGVIVDDIHVIYNSRQCYNLNKGGRGGSSY